VSAQQSHHKTIRNFVFGLGLLLTVGIIASYFLPSMLLLQFQFFRSGIFMVCFCIYYLGYFLYRQYETGVIDCNILILLSAGFLTLGTLVSVVLLWGNIQGLRAVKHKPHKIFPVMIPAQILLVFIALRWQLWSPGIHLKGPESDWRAAQVWAAHHMPLSAKFIAPPYLFGNFSSDWRVFSERATVVSLGEMMEILFNPNSLDSFSARFNAVAPGAIERFNGNLLETLAITKNAYYSHSNETFSELGCRYGAQFLVLEQGHPRDFDLVYNNQSFLIYQLPACPTP
jgi:hypothetical protein